MRWVRAAYMASTAIEMVVTGTAMSTRDAVACVNLSRICVLGYALEISERKCLCL